MVNNRQKKVWHPSSKWLSVFLIAITLIYVITLYCTYNVNRSQYKFNNSIKTNSFQLKNPFLVLKPDTTAKKYYLQEDDIEKLNNHIEYLAKMLETEIDRNQRNAEFNIDRLNLFLTFGIGFLALIGGLLPLAVNFISKHDIESRLIDIEKRAWKSEETVQNAEKKMPSVDLLILQNSVAKLASTETLRLFLGDNQYSDISNMIQRIVSALKMFESGDYPNYSIENIVYLNEILKELKLALKYGPIRKSPSTTRTIHRQIDEIVIYLESNSARTIQGLPQLINHLVEKLSAVKNSFIDLIPKS